MIKNKNILISGAGIAGPTLAYWLAKYGFNPTVVERAPKLRTDGFAIDVRGPGADVVKKMGLWQEIEKFNTNMQGLVAVDNENNKIGELKIGLMRTALGMDKFWIEVMRNDLSKVIYEKTKNHTEYIFGDSIKTISQDDEGVDVNFESGLQKRFDLVIGADGQRSRVRNLVFGNDSQFEKYLGCYVAVANIENIAGLQHSSIIYSVPGKTVYVYSPLNQERAFTFFIFEKEKQLDHGFRDLEYHKQIITESVKNMGWKVPALLEKTNQTSDLYFDSVIQVKMKSWSKGRVVLVGDAGFAPSLLTGQGTQLAMTAAYILAGELKKADGDYEIAFQQYEKVMRPVVKKTQKEMGLNKPVIIPSNNFLIWLRTYVIPFAISCLIATAWIWKRFISLKPSPLIKDY